MSKLEDECFYYEISRTQRETEREQGLTDDGTNGYKEIGCFECNGLDKMCKAYLVEDILNE